MNRFFARLPVLLLVLLFAGTAKTQPTGWRTFKEHSINVRLPIVYPDGSMYATARNWTYPPNPAVWDHLVRADSTGHLTDSVYLPRIPSPWTLIPQAEGPPDVLFQSYAGTVEALDLLRLKPNGDTVWRSTFESPFLISATIMTLQPDTSFVLHGWSTGGPGTVPLLVRLDPSGNILDQAFVGGATYGGTAYNTEDGGVLLLQHYNDERFSLLTKTDSNLTVQWTDTVKACYYGRLRHIPTGGFVLAGNYRGYDGTRNGFRVRRMDGNGNTLWDRFHDRVKTPTVFPNADAAGRISISGSFEKLPGWGFNTGMIARLDPANGDTLWERYYMPGMATSLRDHVCRPDGGLVVFVYASDSCYLNPLTGSMECSGGLGSWLLTDSMGNVEESRLSGMVFADQDGDSLYSPADEPLMERMVTWNGGAVQVLTNAQGRYRLPVYVADTAWLEAERPSFFDALLPAPQPRYAIAMSSLGYVEDSLDFAFTDSVPVADLVATLRTGTLRGGQPFNAFLSVRNNGTQRVDSVTLTYRFDPDFAWVAALPPADAVLDTVATWTLYDLGIGENRTVQIGFVLLDTLTWFDGARYAHHLEALPIAGDWAPEDNTDSVLSLPGFSWDPNDKQVSPPGEGPTHAVYPAPDWLNYTVRFQNTGNDTAFVVRIDDIVRPELDLSSFQMLGSSHPYTLELVANERLRWRFPGIELPDSTTDFAGSQGFVSFRLRPKADWPLGTKIENNAEIYFDFNPAVVTNTAFLTLEKPSIVHTPAALPNLVLAPNPASTAVRVDWQERPDAAWAGQPLQVQIYDLTGRLRRQAKAVLPLTLDLDGVASGLCIVLVRSADGETIGRTRLVVKQ